MADLSVQSPVRTGRLINMLVDRVHWSGPVIMTGAILGLIMALILLVEYREYLNHGKELHQHLKSIQHHARLQLAADIQYLNLLAEKISDQELTIEDYRGLAGAYLEDHPSLVEAVWADAAQVVRASVSLNGNQNLGGLPLAMSESRRAFSLAGRLNKPVYSRPFESVRSGLVFEVQLPVYDEKSFLGSLGLVYSIEKTHQTLNRGLSEQGYHMSLLDDHGFLLASSTLPTDLESNQRGRVPLPLVPGLSLELVSAKKVFGTLERLLLVVVGLMTVLIGYVTMSLMRELTKRKVIELRLQESEARYRAIYDHAGLGIGLGGFDGNLIRTNRAFSEMLGYRQGELDGVSWASLTHPDDSKQNLQLFEEMLSGQRQYYQMEKRYLGKGGRTVWADLTVTCVNSDDGTPLFQIGMVEDISERKKVEEELRKSELEHRFMAEQFRVLLDGIQDAVLMYDRNMTIVWANSGIEDVFDVSRDAVRGEHCYEALQGRQSPCDDCIVLRCLESGISQEGNYHAPDGRVLAIRAFPVFDASGEVQRVIEIAYDASLEVRSQEEILRTGQLASIGELASGVAHEINNPINGIIGYAEILKIQAHKDKTECDIADRILKEGNRIAGIVSGLLSFSRQKKEVLTQLSLKEVLDEVLILVSTQMRLEGILFQVDVPADLPLIEGHFNQLQQVFLNLLNNSRYALNSKYPHSHPDKMITIRGFQNDDQVAMLFHDSGTGIPDHVLGRIMDPFFTTKPDGQGSGLGLSISKGIMQAHHGRLTVKSRENQFCEFQLQFPLPCPR